MKPATRITAVTRGAFLLGLLLGLTGPPVRAQAAPAEDTLARLIKEHEAQRASIERPLLAVYAQRLASLRESLEQRRDPGAAAVATELAAVQAKLNRTETAEGEATDRPDADPTPPAPPTPLSLEGTKARTSGGASTVGDEGSPVHFGGKDSAAEWSLPKLPAGRYRLLWRVACDVGAGATVRLTLDGLPPRLLQIHPTTASGDTIVVNLGEFIAPTPPGWLKIEVLELPGRPRKVGPSFSLGKVVLIPPGVTMTGL
jgi:hypothetical protein